MSCIKGLESLSMKSFWGNFDKILSIPNPSGHEAELVAYLKNLSDENGLQFITDKTGNVVIKKNASPGMEKRPTVILQAHLDMVPQKHDNVEHDFTKDPIKAYIEDGIVKTYGTTLGADDGVGIASIMTLLADKNAVHGPLECLLTVQEEVGLQGASGLEKGLLDGKYLINIDGGPDDTFVIGCAGGVNSEISFKYALSESNTEGKKFVEISISGLKGGHSGADVHHQRGNANKILFRILNRLNHEINVELCNVDSGGLRNAIPRVGKAVVAYDDADEAAFKEIIDEEKTLIQAEFKFSDPKIEVSYKDAAKSQIIDCRVKDNLISAIHVCHNGVIRYFDEIEGAVQTSTNLASVKMDKEKSLINILIMTRSAVQSLKDEYCSKIDSLFNLAGAVSVKHSNSYPGWLPNVDSLLLQRAVQVFEGMFSKKPEQEVVHGGLECGIIGEKYPGVEMISIGPDIQNCHSPEETLNVKSMESSYKFLAELLKQL